ncbi:MAG: hypothetical protein QOG34_2366 [Frankiaceae bacterium]|nr:hypothetical protein [Frankiaceae bacterium]
MRVTALALVAINIVVGWAVAAGPASAKLVPGVITDRVAPFPISQCYTVTTNPPTEIKPSATVCQP